MRMLFMCVANSARSQMAEGWGRALSTPGVEVFSAGSEPTRPRSEAIEVMREVGIDLATHRSKLAADVPTPDVVATLCAEEVCPVYPGDVERLAWATADPAGDHGTREERLDRFRTARDIIRDRMDHFLTQRGLRQSYGEKVRGAFALEPDQSFLNHGSFGATPWVVLQAQRALQEELEAQPLRFMLDQVPRRMRAAAARVAPMLGADPDDLVFVDNATTGTNAVLGSQNFGPGDTIVTTSHAYEAVSNTLQHICGRTGARLHVIDLPFPIRDARHVVEAVARGWPAQARFAVFDHITSCTGLVLPIRDLVALAHEQGVPVMIDGAHVPGHLPVDLSAIGADYWVGNAHKWLFTAKGCAVLHVRRGHHARIHPVVISNGYGQGLTAEFDYVGTRDPSAWLSIGAAIDFVDEMGGLDRVRAHNTWLRRVGGLRLAAMLGVEAPAPDAMLGAMQTLPLPTEAPGSWEQAWELNGRLWKNHRVEAMILPFHGRLWVRTSAQIYNTEADFIRLGEALSAEL